MSDPVVIVSVARTPLGGFQGDLSSLTTPQLGSIAIKAAVERAGVAPAQVQEVIMGCVLPAGLGQAPARQAALGAGLPLSAGCTTINKVCGSGMKATMLAHDLILAGSNEVMVAGGMESMSNAPYLLPKARAGYRLGHGQMFDHMFLDGLEDSYSKENKGRLMGTFAEDCAGHFNFTRQAQDEFAIASTTRAQAAINNGDFSWEVVPVTVASRKGDVVVDKDEQPLKAQIDKIPSLKPAFKKDGTVTPANSSSISDGAAALVLMRKSTAEKLGVKPVATIIGHATHAQEPALFTTAPVGAMQKVLAKAGWSTEQVDLWEINEAFAVVTMAAMHEMKLPHDKVNVNGGACALGHPIGASGARILVSLIGALRKRGLKRGVASLCIGGGEATAMAIEVDSSVACG
ncbi:MAG TPA: acetyl-CoA C-acetyltransferase [Thauera aminoaromatica]|jgi:acetyl-CoA C-acetyltransferase|uniref:Acyl-CoA thiolase n=2 Tax=Thauera aminoaromatica TaxID=164330 RepID=N6YQV3_THASP|nr:acetyl-CoA C-acetyltransferase [Thauera aminoaromatica]ACK53504.1 acetyl-CoA acetyltransferase [Thauera aminoaromatica]ENO84613.1 acyl-CoA thiolase [Thauera aminoaromatica S2]HMX13533.1 acetyl-CoA C-acetyltransferase [Thauera aminoaromatica]HND57907.1 acetyl-CoA C-acetyltransferase [Thauera aminoaromatica]HNF76122.1 acetyl-CoA C-acetyltransferase [Thauera aminoaromatica]